MERKPENRFQTPEELAGELSFLLAPAPRWSESPCSDSGADDGIALPPQPSHEAAAEARTAPAAVVDAQTASIQDLPGVDITVASQTLCLRWQQWFSVLESMARGRKRRIHEKNYQRLHRSLLEAARTVAAVPDSEHKEHARRL